MRGKKGLSGGKLVEREVGKKILCWEKLIELSNWHNVALSFSTKQQILGKYGYLMVSKVLNF